MVLGNVKRTAGGLDLAVFRRHMETEKHHPTAAGHLGQAAGGIIGVVDLMDCKSRTGSPWHVRGNVGWVLTKPRRLSFRACKGALRLFKPEF